VSESYRLDAPDHFTVGTVGPPGQRVFYLQAREARRIVTLKVEKEQVRALIRSDERVRLLVTHADRGFVEEVHFGSTPDEARRIWWDICWIWGPPEDHLETLLQTIGVERFVFGTGQPLRLPENSVAKLDLLDLSAEQRAAIESGNVKTLTTA